MQFSLALLIVVILSNFIKVVCMILMSFQRESEPLVTLGDAIASFLNSPNLTTQESCLATKDDFEKPD